VTTIISGYNYSCGDSYVNCLACNFCFEREMNRLRDDLQCIDGDAEYQFWMCVCVCVCVCVCIRCSVVTAVNDERPAAVTGSLGDTQSPTPGDVTAW